MSEEDTETRERIFEALREVIDPEIGLDIVTLGLVYDVTIEPGETHVTFTLTTPGCPMERAIRGGIEQALARVPNLGDVVAHLVWEPRWHPGLVEEGVL